MLTEVCQYLRNWFERDKLYGWYKIENHVLVKLDGTALPIVSGQYIRIIGSMFNDGVHKIGDNEDELTDEAEFAGAIWLMAVPPDFIKLVEEISNWQDKYGDVEGPNMSPFSSESFGGYSYTKAQGYAGSGGGMLTSWDSVFSSRLAPWRKI